MIEYIMSAIIPNNLNEIYSNLTGYRRNLTQSYRTGAINPTDTLRWTFPKEVKAT
jgi:hypothetical protein